MKFLADMGISPATVLFLRSLEHDAVRLSELGREKLSDQEVIAYAKQHAPVVITFDLDYPALLALNPDSRVSATILPTSSAEPEWVNRRLNDTLPLMMDALVEGAIVVVEDGRQRVRKLPIGN